MPSPIWPACACASLAAAVAGAVFYLPPGGDTSPFEESGRTERLTAEREMQKVGDAFNDALALDLAAGRLSLPAAVAASIEANRERSDFFLAVQHAFPAPSVEASVAAHLTARAWHGGGDDPDHRRTVARRLTAEYRSIYGVPFPAERAGHVVADDLNTEDEHATSDRDLPASR